MVKRLILAAVLLAAAAPAAGQATDDAAGHVTAFACVPLPSPLKVEIETSDGSPQADRLRRALVRSLATRKAVVSPGAPLRLSLYVGSEGHSQIGKGRDLGQFDGSDEDDGNIWIRVDIWSNRRDSVIGGRRNRGFAVVDQLHIEITLDSRANGQCVWQGKAVFKLDCGKTDSLACRSARSIGASRADRARLSLP